MKTVFWSVSKVRTKRGYFLVSYWSKPDRSNELKLQVLDYSEEKLRSALADELGIKHFKLEFVKE